jgi:hypothetical protein
MNKLFLDDIRLPKDAIGLVSSNMNQFYWENDWFVVKNYDEFRNYIEKNGLPDFISFDHDLADFHYDLKPEDYDSMSEDDMVRKFGSMEKTGFDCAKWLVDWCLENSLKLPDFVVHSANPIGKQNIQSYLYNAKKHLL